jgi:GTPase Era involved in 16S rRNA processing
MTSPTPYHYSMLANQSQHKSFPIIAAGTKADLKHSRKVSEGEARRVVEQYEIPELVEISSKTGQNVGLLFVRI